jgi:2-desacetyl-2-hydroxyethyl bacteriochlorophyllide A dehydrogenase
VLALVFTAPGEVRLQEVAEPEPAPGETVVHVRSAGICGSELHGVRDPGFRVPPLIMGHEFAGVAAGTGVIVNPVLSCGQCELCRGGSRQLCRDRAIIGVGRPGGFAERVAVPESALLPKPAGLSWRKAALAEPAATAVHALSLAGGAAAKRVAVLGCGAIGLLSVQAALAAGAASVHVTDPSASRLAVATGLGAVPAGLDRDGAQLDGEYDLIIDAAGTAATRDQSVRHQRPGGRAIWLGLAEITPGFDAQALVRAEKQVIGSFAYTDEDFAAAIGLLSSWDLGWAESYPLESAAEIFTSLMNGALQPAKAVLAVAGEA